MYVCVYVCISRSSVRYQYQCRVTCTQALYKYCVQCSSVAKKLKDSIIYVLMLLALHVF